MPTQTEWKTISTVELKRDGADSGKFKARISTFNVPDKNGDIVRPGAFAATLKAWRQANNRIPVIFDHGASNILNHIGEVSPHDSQETPVGLVVSGQLYIDEERGLKVFRQLQRRALSEWSYAFIPHQVRPLATGGRELLEIELVEIGPTVKGVGETATLEVRAQRVEPLVIPTSAGPRETDARRMALRRAVLERLRM